jgi:glc operon protein GlcG
MRYFWLTLLAVLAVAAFNNGVNAQQPAAPAAPAAPAGPPPGYGAPITLDQAKSAVAAAEAEMKKNNWNMVIAIVGPMGETIYLQKADLAANASITIAQDKARTSALFRTPSRAYQDRLAGGETYVLGLTGVTPVAGGMPIIMGGKVIGAIGISGGTALQDHQVAMAGAGAVR